MPVQTTYPGVYIEEIPSGVRTITGVATSITAFIGRALKGPVNVPVTISNFSDFTRQFGGLWVDSTMSYAVQDFYQNGGSQAIIVRIVNDADTAQFVLDAGAEELTLVATSPGSWANRLLVSVNYDTKDPTAPVLSPPEPPDTNLFNLVIYEQDEETQQVQKIEEYLRVSLLPESSRFLPRVLKHGRVDYAKDEIHYDGINTNWINETTILHEAVHAMHGKQNPVSAKKYGESVGKPVDGNNKSQLDLLKWKAWTEYWAYRSTQEYYNDTQKKTEEEIHNRIMKNNAEVRVAVNNVKQFDNSFDPRTWKPAG